jgi:hypothetical protein
MNDPEVCCGGTESKQNLVQLYNINSDGSDLLQNVVWTSAPGFVSSGATDFGYTTFEYNNCTFSLGAYGTGYESGKYAGIKLGFENCVFTKYGLYGIAGNGGTPVDLYFEDCEFE